MSRDYQQYLVVQRPKHRLGAVLNTMLVVKTARSAAEAVRESGFVRDKDYTAPTAQLLDEDTTYYV